MGMTANQSFDKKIDCSMADFLSSEHFLDDYFKAIQDHLNAGCSPSQLYEAMKQHEGIRMEYSLADFNGDQLWEIVFGGNTCSGGGQVLCLGEAEGGVTIYRWENNEWVAETLYQEWYINQVRIVKIGDLVGSELPELVVKYQEQGSGCSNILHIYQWEESGWQRLEFETLQIGGSNARYNPGYMFCGLKVDFDEKGQNGETKIYLNFATGPGYIAHGGVGRRATVEYVWDGSTYVPTNLVILPSEYRIHAIQDAQVMIDAGKYYEAAYYYQMAANDDTLLNVISLYDYLENSDGSTDPDLERLSHDYQTSFAHFRLVTIWSVLGYPERAQREIQYLASEYPENSPGSEFLDLALYFVEQMNSEKNVSQVCQALTERIDDLFPSLPSHYYWGTYNVSYAVADEICTFQDDQ